MTMRILVAAILALILAATTIGTTEAACRPVFVAGEGVIDSCTGNHRSPYPDPPPQPTVIYVDVTFSPEITVNVSNVVTSTSVSTSSANASAGASASTNNTTYVVKPRIKKPK